MSEQNEDLQEEKAPETEEQKKDKVSKQHAEAVKFVTALVGGEEHLLPRKTLDQDSTAKAVAILFKEEQEESEKKAVESLKELLKKYFLYTEEVKKAEQELEKKKTEKKKEFVQAVNNIKKTFSQQVVQNSGYADALKLATEELEEKE